MEEQGTCPICNKEISLKILNAHVNDHLDNDPFEETINSTYEPPLLNLFSLIKGDKDDSDKKKDSDDKEEEEESEYDKEKEDEDKEDEDNGFEVICPYPGCGKLIGQKVFPSHVFSVHNNEENHSHICPICELMGEVS